MERFNEPSEINLFTKKYRTDVMDALSGLSYRYIRPIGDPL